MLDITANIKLGTNAIYNLARYFTSGKFIEGVTKSRKPFHFVNTVLKLVRVNPAQI